MAKNLEQFIKTIKTTNIVPSYYYTDYQRVEEHLASFRSVVSKLDRVESSGEFINKFTECYNEDNNNIEVTPLFTGVRPDKMIVLNDEGKHVEKFNSTNVTISEAIGFLKEVGFLERIDEYKGIDLPSYFFGVNVGLDSNGRKNRGGKQMERLVGSYIKPIFNENEFKEQATIKDVNKKLGTALNWEGKKEKRIDLVIYANSKIYFIETNFFNSSGSKTDINTRFINLNTQVKNLSDNSVFILITDGLGLIKAKTELEDVINNIEHVYNIDDLENGLISKIKNNEI